MPPVEGRIEPALLTTSVVNAPSARKGVKVIRPVTASPVRLVSVGLSARISCSAITVNTIDSIVL